MQEIHEIREKMSEEHKGLSGQEIVDRINHEAAEVIKKYGLKFKTVISKAT